MQQVLDPMQPPLPTKHTVANAAEQKSPSPSPRLGIGSLHANPLGAAPLPPAYQGVYVPVPANQGASRAPLGRTACVTCGFAALAIWNRWGACFPK